jgi:hypothetical protein
VYDRVQLARSSRLAANAEVEKRYIDAIALEKAEREARCRESRTENKTAADAKGPTKFMERAVRE